MNRRATCMIKQIHSNQFPVVHARDQDLILAKAVLQGDMDAWDTLYENSWKFVLQTAREADYRRLLTPDDYDDVTDEAFTKCYEHLERYQGLSRFCRWVAGYVKNLIRSRCSRKQTASRNQYLLEDIIRSQFNRQDPLLILIRSERDQILWEVFYQLPKMEQDIVLSILFYQCPPRQIAKSFQITKKQGLQYYKSALFKIRWHFTRRYR